MSSTRRVNAIFPTAVYQNNLDGFHDMIEANLSEYWFDAEEGIQGEYLGKANMQTNPNLSSFYSCIADEIRVYMDVLGIDGDLFDLYFVKSCLSKISKPEHHMVAHRHYCSHVSFVYYHSVPPNSDHLFLYNKEKNNELFGNMINHERDRSFLFELNPFNASHYYIEPEPGLLVVFPSHVPHGTARLPEQQPMTSGDRVAIVGDVHLVLKQEQDNWETGLPALGRWQKF